MAITTGTAPAGARPRVGQDPLLVPTTTLHSSAPESISRAQWVRLRTAIRASEDLADAASHIATIDPDDLARVHAVAEAEQAWVESTLGLDAASLLQAAEDARWHTPGQAVGVFRTCRHCRREHLGLDADLPLTRERNYCPDPDPPELLDWAQLVTVEDVQRLGDLPRGWWR